MCNPKLVLMSPSSECGMFGVRSIAAACVRSIALLCVASASPALAGVVIVPGWGAPVFQDNFSGPSINVGVWEVAHRSNDANNEQQYYHPNQVSVASGGLRLRADRDPNWTYGKNYNSGLVRTWQEWSYGRFEVRAKLPSGQGFWPAIWLLPRTAAWPAGGEIDIMEARGDAPYGMSSALHWGWDFNSRQYRSQWYESGANFQAGYHDYAVEWGVGVVRFFVDGINHYTLYEPEVGIPGTPKSLILNLAVGGDYSGFPNGNTPFPASFDIDYVRVWQRPDILAPPVSLVADPGFEQGGGALDSWGVFGNSIGNVLSDYGTPLDGERSLKLYGQFNSSENYSGVFQSISINEGFLVSAATQTLTRSEDSIAGSGNQALMKLEFYSATGAAYGSEHFLGEASIVIADRHSPEDIWSGHQIEALTPAGAVEARVALVFVQPATNDGGSVFVDGVVLSATRAGDYNGDGVVDAADYTVWRDGNSPDSGPGGYDLWTSAYRAVALPLPSPYQAESAPEPASMVVLILALLSEGVRRRKN